MPKIRISAEIISEIHSKYQNQILNTGTRSWKFYALKTMWSDGICIYNHLIPSKEDLGNDSTLRSEISNLQEISIFPEKCRHIPAGSFKKMWTEHYQNLYKQIPSCGKGSTESSQNSMNRDSNDIFDTNLDNFDLAWTKITLKWRNDKIQASVFTLLPIIDFEFYKVKHIPIDHNSIHDLSNICNFGYLSAQSDQVVPFYPDIHNFPQGMYSYFLHFRKSKNMRTMV